MQEKARNKSCIEDDYKLIKERKLWTRCFLELFTHHLSWHSTSTEVGVIQTLPFWHYTTWGRGEGNQPRLQDLCFCRGFDSHIKALSLCFSWPISECCSILRYYPEDGKSFSLVLSLFLCVCMCVVWERQGDFAF